MKNGPVPSTTPKDQFVVDVLPCYRDFLADPTLEHRAKAVANALAHFAEHVFVYYQYHDPSVLAGTARAADFNSLLARTKQCEDLDVIWDLALAGKHRFITRRTSRQRYISTATTAITIDPLITGSSDAFLAGVPSQLRLNLQDGRQPLFIDVLEAVMSFWRCWLPYP